MGKLPRFRTEMDDKQKADYIHKNGIEKYLAIPSAPIPSAEELEGLNRSSMSYVTRMRFIQKYGQARFDLLPS